MRETTYSCDVTDPQAVYDAAKAEWGAGWEHLSEKQQKSAVSDAIVHILLCSKVTSGSPLEGLQLLAVRSLQLVGSDVEHDELSSDPNDDKYTCQPYGVPKCPKCLYPDDDCRCD